MDQSTRSRAERHDNNRAKSREAGTAAGASNSIVLALEAVRIGLAQGGATSMTIKRMDHVSVVVDDLPAAIAFFTTLGMTLEGQTPVEGPWVDRLRSEEHTSELQSR